MNVLTAVVSALVFVVTVERIVGLLQQAMRRKPQDVIRERFA